MSSVHHVELWVPDLAASAASWGWLLTGLGWEPFQQWRDGRSWRAGDGTYLVLEQSSAMIGDRHRRTAPGLNHLALTASGRDAVDRVAEQAPAHGWSLLFADRHPYAGGPDHYAAFLEDTAGYEVEVVAVP